jgi:hypothetical protein
VQTHPWQPPDAQTALRRGLISGVAGLLLVVITTVAVTRSEIHASALSDMLGRAQLGPMVLSWAFITVAFLFLGMRWRALIPKPYTPPGSGLAAILCAGLLLNTALPGPVGEFGAAWFAHRRYRIPLALSLAAGVGARLIGLLMASIAAVLTWVFADLPVPEGYDTVIAAVAAVIGCMAIGLMALAVAPRMLITFSKHSVGRFSGTGWLGRASQKIHGLVVEVAEALVTLHQGGWRPLLRCLAWSGIAHGFVVIGITIAAMSLGAEPSLPGLLFTYATTTAAVVVMFALPGSQVGWDAIFLSLLTATAGLSVPDALAVAVVVRVQQLSIMVAGAVALSWIARGIAQEPAEE